MRAKKDLTYLPSLALGYILKLKRFPVKEQHVLLPIATVPPYFETYSTIEGELFPSFFSYYSTNR